MESLGYKNPRCLSSLTARGIDKATEYCRWIHTEVEKRSGPSNLPSVAALIAGLASASTLEIEY